MIDLEFRGARWSENDQIAGPRLAKVAHSAYKRNRALTPLRAGRRLLGPPREDLRNLKTLVKFYDKWIASTDRLDVVETPSANALTRRFFYAYAGALYYMTYDELPRNLSVDLLGGTYLGITPPEPKYYGATNVVNDFPRAGQAQLRGLSAEENPNITPAVRERSKETSVVYTYVNRHGDESAPSVPFITCFYNVDGFEYTFTDFSLPSIEDDDVIGFRFYMSVAGVYYQIRGTAPVADPDIGPLNKRYVAGRTNYNPGDTTYVVRLDEDSIDFTRPLISLRFDPPPRQGMKHMADMGDGLICAATDNEVMFSIRYRPYALPIENRRHVTGTIKRIASIAGGVVVMTDKKTHVFLGTDGDNMQEVSSTFDYPIGDPRSVTKFGTGIAYMCHEGVAYIDVGRAQILTDEWIDKNDWRERATVDECVLSMYEGRLILITRNPDTNLAVGYLFHTGEREVFSFDATEAAMNLGFWRHEVTGDLGYVTDDSGMYAFNQGDYLNALWASGVIDLQRAMSMNTVKVIADSYPVTVLLKTEKGVESVTVNSRRPQRIKPTGRSRTLEVLINTNTPVARVTIGAGMSDV